jgi:hypothetical protein
MFRFGNKIRIPFYKKKNLYKIKIKTTKKKKKKDIYKQRFPHRSNRFVFDANKDVGLQLGLVEGGRVVAREKTIP